MKRTRLAILLTVVVVLALVLVACQPSEPMPNPDPQPTEQVTVTFDTAGGTMSEPATVKVDKGSYLQLPVPTRTGYTFLGWFVGEGVNAGQVTDATAITQDITITAHWKVNTYTVSFETGTDEEIEPMEVTFDQPYVIPTLERTGYKFLGWFDGEDKVESGIWNISRNTTLVAHWQANTYTVTFETGIGQEIEPMEVTFGEQYMLPTLERTGYTFLGWYYQQGWYGDKTYVSTTGTWNITNNITLTAGWQAQSYNVSFAETGDSSIDDITVTYDKSYTLPTPTRTGYTFLGWFEGDNKVESGTWNRTRDVVLVAHWQVNTYTVTFETGMDQEIEPMEVTFGEQYTLPSPEREHYTFMGWYNNYSEVGLTGNWSIARDVTLVASWQEVGYTVTYNNAEDCFNENPTTITISQLPYTLKDAGKNDHVFEGWYSDPDFTTRVTQIDRLGVTLYAKFTVATSGLQFSSDYNGVEVTGYNGTDSDIIIPSYHDGFVTSIGSSAFEGYSITSVIIPSSVTSIGGSAFWGCSSLESIVIPSSVTSIGDSAFLGCSSLASVVIPSSVTSIGEDAFYNCSSLTSIAIPSSVTSIGDSAFWGCSSLANIVIPSSVTSIGDWAFRECSNLTNIVIPTSVTSIGDYAFSHCYSLESIVIPSSVISIGEDAFWSCSSLESIVIPSSVTSIGEDAFYNCNSLASIVIPSSVTSIGDSAFSGCSSLTIYCEASSQPMSWNANWNSSNRPVMWGVLGVGSTDECDYVLVEGGIHLSKWKGTGTVVTMPSEVGGHPVLGFGAIFANSNVTAVVIPSSVTSIGDSAFYGCRSLESIVIPSSVTSIGESAFSYCSSLASIVIPSSVTSIGNYAFSGCSSLTIYCEASSQPMGWNANWNSNRPVVWGVLGVGSTDECDYVLVEGGIHLSKWKGTGTVVTMPSEVDGHPVLGFGTIFANSNVTAVVIPSSVTSIGEDAFSWCSSLESIVIPSSVTSIGGSAFYGCSSLTSIVIPSSVTSIGESAFYNCSSLESIVIPSSVTSIGYGVFGWCGKLTIYCEAESQPMGWSASWNFSNRPVVWGYKG